MASNSWIASGSGDWTNASNWSEGTYPGSGGANDDDASIATGSTAVTVTLSTPDSYEMNSLTIGVSDTLFVSNAVGSSGATQILLDGSFYNQGNITIADGQLTMDETLSSFKNNGTINIQDSYGILQVSSDLTLEGSGSGGSLPRINLQGGSIVGDGNETIENASQRIGGAGTISDLILTNDAAGIVEANGGELDLDDITINNAGELGSTYTDSTLVVAGPLTNTGNGYVTANQSGAVVVFKGATTTGGLLESSNGGSLEASNEATLDGVTISGTMMSIDTMNLADTTTIEGVTAFTGANIYLEGGEIVSNQQNDELVNKANIYGTGGIGDGDLDLDNFGSIEADGGELDLALDASANATVVNEAGAFIAADQESTLFIGTGDPNGSTFTNKGTLAAISGQFTIGQGVAMTNFDGKGDLIGATYEASGEGGILQFNSTFSSIKAFLILDGAGSVIQSIDPSSGNTVKLESMLTDIQAGGKLEILDGRGYSATNAITIEGSLQIAGGTFKSGRITSTGTLISYGASTISSYVTQTSGIVEAAGGDTLTLTAADTFNGTIAGAGTTIFSKDTVHLGTTAKVTAGGWMLSSAALVLATTGLTYAGVFNETASTITFATGNSTLTLSGTTTLTGGSISGASTLALSGVASSIGFGVGGGATMTVAKSLDLKGALVLGTAAGNGTAGTLSIKAGAVLDLSDGGSVLPSGAKAVMTNAGTIEKADGTLVSTVGTALANSGILLAEAGTLDLNGAVTGTGTATIEKRASLEFDAAVASTQKVSFGTLGGKLLLYAAPTFAGSVAGLGAGDTIDVYNFGTATTLTYTANAQNTGGVLKLTNGSVQANLTLVGSYSQSGFHQVSSSSSTAITYTAPAPAAHPAAVAADDRHVADNHPAMDTRHVADLAAILFEGAFGPSSIHETAHSLLAPSGAPGALAAALDTVGHEAGASHRYG